MRGNLVEEMVERPFVGSIPAGAGEPSLGALRQEGSRVYPRGCGGTGPAIVGEKGPEGLSPRVRGNHHRGPLDTRVVRVYPRGCGGTPINPPPPGTVTGLSPRVRGNHISISFA